jgi:putative peptidoglycan lipid II flippase
MGFLGLVIANSVQLLSHAIIMLVLFRRRFGGIRGRKVVSSTARALVASVAMGACSLATYQAIVTRLNVSRTLHEAVLVAIPGAVGFVAYLICATLLRVEEISLIWAAVGERLRGLRH